MPKILYGNFDFEHELESPDYRPTAKLQAIAAQLVPHLISLADDGDLLWSEAGLVPLPFLEAAFRAGFASVTSLDRNSVPSPLGGEGARRAGEGDSQSSGVIESQPSFEFLPWGHSAVACDFARQNAWSVEGPDPAIVRRVNDRAFATQLETELNCGLPGSRLIHSHPQLLEAIREMAAQFSIGEDALEWVAKSRFGMASRGRILGRGTSLDDPSTGWLGKQFDRNDAVQFEPWVRADAEFSTQWVIPQCGEPVLRGWTRIHIGRGGTQIGWSREAGVEFAESEFSSALPMLRTAVERIAAEGYFGPVGIDSMRCVLPGAGNQTTLRPLQEINARFTMGRLALETADRLAPDSHVVWLHLPAETLCRWLEVNSPSEALSFYSERGLDISEPLGREGAFGEATLGRDGDAWLTSPLWMGDSRAARCGVLITGQDFGRLARLCQKLEFADE